MKCGIEQVVLEVTEGCNHTCSHCYNYWRGGPVGRKGPQASPSQLLELIRKIRRDAPVDKVALSGGEPLLRDDTAGIVCDLTDEGLSTVVITNGSLLTPGRLRAFPEGTVFEVTLFSADEAVHNRLAGRRVFSRILENLVHIEKYKCRLVLAHVVTSLNAFDTFRTIELGIALGADAVLLNRVNVGRRMYESTPDIVPSAADLRCSLEAAEECAQQYEVTIGVSVPVPPCVVDPLPYAHLQFGWCPRGGRNAYYTVSPSGMLRPCNHSSRILGDLNEQEFGELVLGEKARDFWSVMPVECDECTHELKESCCGGCPAAADEVYRTRARMDPFVELITREG